MDTRSESNLEYVEPDLCKVVRAAAQTPQPFVVTYGLRTLLAEEQAVATGHSQTLHSRHLADKNGLSAAVDITPLIEGEASFCKGHEAEVYGQVAEQMKAAAAVLGIVIEWGGDWTREDWGHFQLPWTSYP